MDTNGEHLEEKAKHLEKKAKKLLKSLSFIHLPNHKAAGEAYTELYNIYTKLGLEDSSIRTADSAVKSFTKVKDWFRAAKVSQELTRSIMCRSKTSREEISSRVKATVELFMKAEQIDDAIQLLEKTAALSHKDEPRIASDRPLAPRRQPSRRYRCKKMSLEIQFLKKPT